MILSSLALIILNYNSYDDTVHLVDQLIEFCADYHVIIVDNASPDGSGKRLMSRYEDMRIVDVVMAGVNGGYGAGNNVGFRYAEDKYGADVMAVLNPDVEIPDLGVINTMHETLMSDERIGIVGSVIGDRESNADLNHSAWPVVTARQFARKQSLFSRRYAVPFECIHITADIVRVGCVAGCFFMIRTETLHDVGYYDEDMFLYNEEDVLGIKCQLKGWKVVLALSCAYFHNHHDSDGILTFDQKIHATNASYVSAKYVCREYYDGRGLVTLWMAEATNMLYLAAAYFRNKLIGR